DIIVHLGRLRDRSRRVLEITEVLDCKEGEIRLNPLYSFIETGEENGRVKGSLTKVNELVHMDKLLRAGVKLDYEQR
ncbi:MAG TPA: CpaF family protein, partial [Mobilitalea sp.]|nr:CpaF family protein [Mobilitalea sp.]